MPAAEADAHVRSGFRSHHGERRSALRQLGGEAGQLRALVGDGQQRSQRRRRRKRVQIADAPLEARLARAPLRGQRAPRGFELVSEPGLGDRGPLARHPRSRGLDRRDRARAHRRLDGPHRFVRDAAVVVRDR